jgi:16S rRNA (uracil1498-N3)-methyltransferase
MAPRFLVPDLDPRSGRATLPEDEAHHLTRVLRLREGDEVAVFDGRGVEFRARVDRAERGRVTVELVEPVEPAPESSVPFTLAQSVLKGDAMDDVVRDATMLGARAIVPLITAHTAVKASVLTRPATTERWRRIALASAKQCCRATVPAIAEPRAFADWLRSTDDVMKLLFVEPSAAAGARPLRSLFGLDAPPSAALIVGPEGGWSADEIRAAVQAGCLPVTLGRLTLRADAVPVAAIAAVRLLWDD